MYIYVCINTRISVLYPLLVLCHRICHISIVAVLRAIECDPGDCVPMLPTVDHLLCMECALEATNIPPLNMVLAVRVSCDEVQSNIESPSVLVFLSNQIVVRVVVRVVESYIWYRGSISIPVI